MYQRANPVNIGLQMENSCTPLKMHVFPVVGGFLTMVCFLAAKGDTRYLIGGGGEPGYQRCGRGRELDIEA